ncbi:MAG TPA: hypothetical protein VN915_09020 [Elusimicrobiota bacterium]|nr:hypothetical protein [Elusimicrobiota bacterium]
MKPLKPVMAAILAASSFSFPLAMKAAADEAPQLSDADAHARAANHDDEFVQRLMSFVGSKPEVRQDIGARLQKFVLNRAKGRQYLTTGLLDDKTLIKMVVKAAQDWPETNKGNAEKVAKLYYVLGMDADKLPAWAPAGYEDEFKPNAVWSKRLAAALSGDKWDSTKQVAQAQAANGTVALLDSAADWAVKILKDARDKREIHGSIDSNATTALKPPTEAAPARNPLDTTGSGFDSKALYEDGAVVAHVYGPHDSGFRNLSMKVYTMKDDNGNFYNKIGVVDITQPDVGSPSATQWIDASKAGDTDIVFRDGGRHYTATVKPDGTVTLKRAGTNDGEGGSISTNKDELSLKRDDQIASGGVVGIGQPPQPYYVLGQGGQKGSFLFFPKSQIDAMRAAHDAGKHPDLNAHPDLMGDVVQAGNDGAVPIKGKPDLGSLPNGDPYHLEFDPSTRMWKVMPGKGDPPAGANPAGSTATVTGSGGSGGTTGTVDQGTPKTLNDAIAAAKAGSPAWVEDDGNGGFDDASLGLIRIMSRKDNDGTHFKALFDSSLGVRGNPKKGTKDNEFEFQVMNDNIRLNQIRGLKNYVVLDYSVGAQYYDVQNFANYVQHSNNADVSYSSSGGYDVGKKQMAEVTNADIVQDILTHYMGVKPSDAMIATVQSRIAEHSKGKGFVISGSVADSLVMGVGEKDRQIWPDDIDAGDKGSNETMTGLRGPGTAVQVTGGERGEYATDPEIGNGRTAHLERTENNAALYSAEEDENQTRDGKPTVVTVPVWSIMIDYVNDTGRPSRTKALPVFGGGKNRYPLPDKETFHMQGLPNVKLPASTQLALVGGSTAKNGAIAAYRFAVPDKQGAANVKDTKGNCGGVVLWWGGVTKEKAQAACEKGGKL